MKPTLVFDYDGTIHETLRIYEPAFRRCLQYLQEAGFVDEKEVSTDRLKGWLGVNSKDMWLDFMPDLSEEIRQQASKMVGEGMIENIASGHARWYENAVETLDVLKQNGYSMVILSNSKKRYGETNFRVFGMEKWFDRWYDCESFGFIPKTEIIKEIVTQYGDPIVVIGDRALDIAAAKSIGAKSVGCLYGYGTREELQDADYLISDIKELIGTLRDVNSSPLRP